MLQVPQVEDACPAGGQGPGPNHVLETRDLELFYGSLRALKGITLAFERNKITALIGPSGCGKSTFLRCLNRMNDLIPGASVRGEVLLDGANIYAPGTDVVELRKRVGMVFQRPVAFPLSVYDNVACAPRVHGVTRRVELDAIVERSLEAVGLWSTVKDKLAMPALNLTLGQQQQLTIARAIATSPDVVLLDEPCSALDPASTLRIEELMGVLARTYTIVIVTHNMQQAARASDHTAFMLAGELVEFGPTKKLFTSPADPRTESYVTGRLG